MIATENSLGFVNEKISDGDKNRYESYGLVSPITRKPVPPWKWTVDRARDAVLISLGGQGDPGGDIPRYFVLIWRGQIIRFETTCKSTGNVSDGYRLAWTVARVAIPRALANEKDAAMNLLREALDASGLYFDREHVNEVRFDSVATPSIVVS